MDFFENIGNNILFELKKKNLDKSVFAEKIGISKQVFEKIIQGKKAINSFEIDTIAEALCITSDNLLISNEKVPYENQNIYEQFLDKFDKKDNFKLLWFLIEEYINMEGDFNEFQLSKRNNRH